MKNEEDVKNYVFIEWRGLASKKDYEPFTNNSIITFGMRKDLSLGGAFPVSQKGKQRRKTRPSVF